MKTRHWKTIRRLRRIESKRRRYGRRIAKRLHEYWLADEHRLSAPVTFGLFGSHQPFLVEFLANLRCMVGSGSKPVRIDFRKTEMMYTDGTLLFYSELHRLKDMFPSVPFSCTPSKSERVNQVLKHLGLFRLLGYESAVVPSRPDVISWRVVSSAGFDANAVGQLIEKYSSLKGANAGYLFRSATEAMYNAVRHAYLDRRRDGLPEPSKKEWWMFVQEGDEELTVAICDLGIGIPRSLPKRHLKESIEQAISHIPLVTRIRKSAGKADAEMIHAAMEINRTRTGKAGNGKGLNDLRRIVDEVPGGRMLLLSNRGALIYRNGLFERRGFESSIKGTLVLWNIPLK